MEQAFRDGRGDFVHLQGPAAQLLEHDGVGEGRHAITKAPKTQNLEADLLPRITKNQNLEADLLPRILRKLRASLQVLWLLRWVKQLGQ